MSDRIRQVIFSGRRWFFLGSLLFSRLYSVSAARASLAELTPAVDPEPDRPRQLLADVSVIARKDAGTGIQRVVKELLRELIANPPPGFEVRLVRESRWLGYRYAEQYRGTLPIGGHGSGPTGPVRVMPGDIFLGMDLAAYALPRRHFQLGRWKTSGLRFHFLVYDLLPALHPEWFTPRTVKAYRNWIRTVAIFANSAVCISQSVAEELKLWLTSAYGEAPSQSISVKWFHLSGDIPATAQGRALSDELDQSVARIGIRPTVLMVGTVEPRKNYAQALSAFEILWREGRNINLVIVGRAGWKVDDLIQKLHEHPEAGNRLFWFQDAEDEQLFALYKSTDGLLMTSEGEGFGLPIVEAARHAKPLLLRDIPIFREIAGEHAQYFAGTNAKVLAATIDGWVGRIRDGSAISSCGINSQTWRESAKQLIKQLELT